MTIHRETIQKYIDSIYEENKIITFTAPTGFGTHIIFMKVILNDVMSSKKSCIVMIPMTILLDEIQETVFNLIEDKNVLENRTKNFLLFKNGSSINYYVTSKDMNGTESPDILYMLDSNKLIGNKLSGIISLIYNTDRILVISNSAGDMSMVKHMRYNTLCYSFDLKKIDDLLIEIRRLKIQRIKNRI